MVTLSKYVVVLLLLATPAAGQPAAEHAASPPATTPAPPPAPAADDSPSWGSLFRNLGVDFKHLASTDTVVMLGVAGGASVAVHGQDARVTRRASGSAGLDTVFEPGAMLGGGALQIGGALATFALGKATSHPRLAMVGADLVRAQVVTSALTHGLKLAVDRQRPDGTRFSFPSGHTSATFASAAVLHRHFGWKAALPAYGLATYVAGSRLQENRHYMSDVIFGAALGIVAGRAVTIGRGQARFVVSPFAAPGGGGVGLTLAGNR